MNPKSKSGSPPSLVLRSRPTKPRTPPTNLPNKTSTEAVLVKGGFRWFLQFDGGQSMTDAMLIGFTSLSWKDFLIVSGRLVIIHVKEATLVELYELPCKSEDDLRVKPDKIRKHKANKDNDKHLTRRIGSSWQDKESFKMRSKAHIVVVMIAGLHQAQEMTRLGLH
ncbi:hypothetical protein Tco_1287808 [Tanacetum coccineum]